MYTTYREKEIHKSKNPKSPNPAKDYVTLICPKYLSNLTLLSSITLL